MNEKNKNDYIKEAYIAEYNSLRNEALQRVSIQGTVLAWLLGLTGGFLGAALTLAVFSFLASSSPDGLERVAEKKNFIEKSASLIRAPIADYLFPGITNEKLSGALAGITGVLIVFSLGIGLSKLIHKKQ